MILAAATMLMAAVCVDPVGEWPLGTTDMKHCPQVYRLVGSAETSDKNSLNIVILSSGFTEAELDTYRCAAQLTAERLAALPPYDCYPESINIYRIDLASERSGVGDGVCGSEACRVDNMPWATQEADCAAALADPAEPVLPSGQFAGECMNLDLEVSACPEDGPYCRVLWPSGRGQRMLYRLAACQPSFNVVVVLANTREQAGGGIEDAHRLAVTTLAGVGSGENRAGLLAHELGHALGLFDEYSNGVTYEGGEDGPTFHADRNVVQGGPDGPPRDPPWADRCDDGEGNPAPCEVQCNCDANGCKTTISGLTPATGLYEGGYYERCGYFTASNTCRMRELDDQEYCAGCMVYLMRFLEEGMHLPRCEKYR